MITGKFKTTDGSEITITLLGKYAKVGGERVKIRECKSYLKAKQLANKLASTLDKEYSDLLAKALMIHSSHGIAELDTVEGFEAAEVISDKILDPTLIASNLRFEDPEAPAKIRVMLSTSLATLLKDIEDFRGFFGDLPMLQQIEAHVILRLTELGKDPAELQWHAIGKHQKDINGSTSLMHKVKGWLFGYKA